MACSILLLIFCAFHITHTSEVCTPCVLTKAVNTTETGATPIPPSRCGIPELSNYTISLNISGGHYGHNMAVMALTHCLLNALDYTHYNVTARFKLTTTNGIQHLSLCHNTSQLLWHRRPPSTLVYHSLPWFITPAALRYGTVFACVIAILVSCV
ncbi:glycoprotein 4 [Hedgehog arterivirus]|nr:glycoprotein 4 [Hedgehog arterivirus]